MAKCGGGLRDARETNMPLCVCCLGVSDLTYINEQYGTEAGDRVLLHTVQAVRNSIQKQDSIGRMLSDDFIVLMPGCDKALARIRMLQANRVLGRIYKLPDSRPVSFNFGIVDSGDITFGDDATDCTQMLKLAEARMLQHKKSEELTPDPAEQAGTEDHGQAHPRPELAGSAC